MSEDTTVSDGESEETTKTTSDSESENTSAAEEDTSSSKADSGEEKDKAEAFDESLLETEDSKTPPAKKEEKVDAHTNKQKQVDIWVKRFDGRINPKTGNPYSYEDMPKEHDWLKQEVADKLHELEKSAPDIKPQSSGNTIEDFEFIQLKKQVPDLPKSKQVEIGDLFKELKADGVKSDYKALKRALDIAKIELEAEKRGKKAAYMKVSGGGSSGGIDSDDKPKVSSAFKKKIGMNDKQIKKAENFDFLNPNKNAS